jgi:hypothetical protein
VTWVKICNNVKFCSENEKTAEHLNSPKSQFGEGGGGLRMIGLQNVARVLRPPPQIGS